MWGISKAADTRMGSREYGRSTDRVADNDKLGYLHIITEGSLNGKIPEETWGKSTRGPCQNEISYIKHCMWMDRE